MPGEKSSPHLNRLHSNFMCGFVTIIFIAVTFCQEEIACKYSKLKFGIRIISIGVSKQKLCILRHFVYNQTYSKEIHPRLTPFSRVKGFRVVPVSIGACVAFLCRKASNSSKGQEGIVHDSSCHF